MHVLDLIVHTWRDESWALSAAISLCCSSRSSWLADSSSCGDKCQTSNNFSTQSNQGLYTGSPAEIDMPRLFPAHCLWAHCSLQVTTADSPLEFALTACMIGHYAPIHRLHYIHRLLSLTNHVYKGGCLCVTYTVCRLLYHCTDYM